MYDSFKLAHGKFMPNVYTHIYAKLFVNIISSFFETSFFFATFLLQDVGDGWWEGSIDGGPLGLFPATYVEEVGGEFLSNKRNLSVSFERCLQGLTVVFLLVQV